MLTRKIGYLLFEGFTAMDLVGPLEAFNTVSEVSEHRYEAIMIGLKAGPVASESSVVMMADVGIDEVTELDTLVIPGGAGAREPSLIAAVSPWLGATSGAYRRIISVCTGSFLLAHCGLLNHIRATTHWAFADKFRWDFPDVELVPDALYIDNGKVATSAGIASGIDLSLKLIEDDLGAGVATQVARYLVVHYRRSGDQAQFSQPLRYQGRTNSQFSSLIAWILENLTEELNLEILAEKSGMSVRSFCRKFKAQLGVSPGRFIEQLRLDYARQLLVDRDWPVVKVSQACGYRNLDVFRRAFERRFQLSPKAYRVHFSG